MKNAFTLIEMLIAIAISSLIAVGLFSMFKSVTSVQKGGTEKSEQVVIIESITKLVNQDIRMMIADSLSVDKSDKLYKLKLMSQNSLRFNKALPVDISYYVDEDGWLVRRETNTGVLFDMEMKLIPNVSDLTFEFYDGVEYKDEATRNAKLFKINMKISDSPVTILAARTFEN